MKFKILCRLTLNSNYGTVLLPIALEVGRHKTEALLILFRDRLSNKKNSPKRRIARTLKLRESVKPISKQNQSYSFPNIYTF
jgi:hypothetical protein